MTDLALQPDTRPPAPAPLAVELRGATKRFGDVQALDALDLVVPQGNITVLLGPNGAGKTTAIRTITGALPIDAGTARTLGLDPVSDGTEVRRRCGIVSAKPSLYERLSGWDNLDYAASLYGVDDAADLRIRDAAGRFGIADALDRLVGGYSTGMKTRLALARSVLHRPDLLLFDEPTSGLDPESAAAVLDLIREMTADGTTVVMCTHHLVEAEGLADQVVILDEGRALRAGSQSGLLDELWPVPTVRLATGRAEDVAELAALPGVRVVEATDIVTIEVDHLDRVPGIVEHLVAAGAHIHRVEPQTRTLEELYLRVRADRRNGGDGADGPREVAA